MPIVRKLDTPPPEGFVCKECLAEGQPAPQPIEAFYLVRAPEYHTRGHWRKYKDDRQRSTLCKRHHNLAETERQRRRLDPSSDTYDAAYHERVKDTKKRWARKRLDPDSAAYDPQLHESQKAAKRKYAARRRQERQQP